MRIEKVFSRLKKLFHDYPTACILVAWFLLTGAATGMTAQYILTAAPSSGSVNLASATGTEGTSNALMRTDATLGVTGILPILNGGTGSSTFPPRVTLQAATPGTADTGHANISGTMMAGFFIPTLVPTGSQQFGASGTGFAWKATGGTGAYSLNQTSSQTVTCDTTAHGNSAVDYIVYSANGSQFASMTECGRLRLGNGPAGGITSFNGSTINIVVNNTVGPLLSVDSGVFALAATQVIEQWGNNGTVKTKIMGDGSIQQTGVTFASLGTPGNGVIGLYCSDCTIANPCASGGTGAVAKRLNGVWVCN